MAAAVADRLVGVEALSGIPGLVGASPVQNIGAYGQDVAQTVTAVRARIAAAAERYAAARERLAVFDAALLRGAREERESALASYRTRGLSLLELLDFERALARAEIDRVRAGIWKYRAKASVAGELACEAELMCTMRKVGG